MSAKTKILTTRAIEKRFSILRTVLAILIALVIAFILIASVSDKPLEDMMTFVFGPLTSVRRLATVVEKLIPLLFTGTAVCLMYSCGQVNLAAEGAFFAGAFTSTAIAIQPGIPAGLHFVLCLLAGCCAGAIVCGIPGIMQVKFNVMTVVSSLMINYVALYLGLYLILNPLRDPSAGFEASFRFAKGATLPVLFKGTNVHAGLFIGLLVVLLGYYLQYRTTFGYSLRTIGSNPNFAKYSGISVGGTIIATQLLAGGIAGAGGTVEVLGMYSRFSYSGFTNHGWDGIMIAVLAKNNPRNVPFAALFLGYIRAAADVLNRTSNVPTEVVRVVQSVVIVFIAAESLLSGWEHKRIVENSRQAAAIVKEG